MVPRNTAFNRKAVFPMNGIFAFYGEVSWKNKFRAFLLSNLPPYPQQITTPTHSNFLVNVAKAKTVGVNEVAHAKRNSYSQSSGQPGSNEVRTQNNFLHAVPPLVWLQRGMQNNVLRAVLQLVQPQRGIYLHVHSPKRGGIYYRRLYPVLATSKAKKSGDTTPSPPPP